MQVTITPSAIKGSLSAPASKSVMQRACAAAFLREGETIIHNYGKSDDDKAALRIIQDAGASVAYIDDHSLKISSKGIANFKGQVSGIHCGESGLSIRMFTPLVALFSSPVTITGSGSLERRPMDFFDRILPELGVKMTSNNGHLPLQIQGPLVPRNITIDGNMSSQFLTGLLFAYAAADATDVAIKCLNLKSRPYIDLTLKVMEDFGMKVPVHKDYQDFYFSGNAIPGNKLPASGYTIESDWSSASFLLVAGAIAGNITVTGLDVFSTQADKKILEALQDCGCRMSIQVEQIEVGYHTLRPFHFDATDCPDLFPPLVALAAYCKGTSVIEGVERLLHKESNRALTLQQQFGKLGIAITIQDDKMMINGGTGVQAATVHSCHDHRIAMACAIAALGAEGAVTIEAASAINKSYPDFYEHLARLTQHSFKTVQQEKGHDDI